MGIIERIFKRKALHNAESSVKLLRHALARQTESYSGYIRRNHASLKILGLDSQSYVILSDLFDSPQFMCYPMPIRYSYAEGTKSYNAIPIDRGSFHSIVVDLAHIGYYFEAMEMKR